MYCGLSTSGLTDCKSRDICSKISVGGGDDECFSVSEYEIFESPLGEDSCEKLNSDDFLFLTSVKIHEVQRTYTLC